MKNKYINLLDKSDNNLICQGYASTVEILFLKNIMSSLNSQLLIFTF